MGEGSSLYDEDLVRWSAEQAAALRAAASSGTNLPLDWENIAEEIESLGRSVRAELRSRIAVIVEHLLKLEHSPAQGPRRRWMQTVLRERGDVQDLLDENPSLQSAVEDVVLRSSARSAQVVALALGGRGELPKQVRERIQAASPYTSEQVLGEWWPASALLDGREI